MSNDEDNANYTDYDEDSFDDNASIEEVSEYEGTDSEVSNDNASDEVILEEDNTIKSLSESIDKVSYVKEDDNDKLSNEEEDKDLLSSSSIEVDDNEENEMEKETNTNEAQLSSPQKDEHEIDETDSEVDNEFEVDIADSIKSLAIKPSAPIPRDSKCNNNDKSGHKTNYEEEIEFNVTSRTPTSFNSDNHAFHMDIIHQKRTPSNASLTAQRSRNANRKSLSFSNERMREIERHNQILLKKILTQKPRKDSYSSPKRRTSSAAVNRKKQQRQIDFDNQILRKKIEAISARRRHTYHP